MDPRVYYKTAGATYDRLLDNGPLTDEKIEMYERIRKGLPPHPPKVKKTKKDKEAARLAWSLETYL